MILKIIYIFAFFFILFILSCEEQVTENDKKIIPPYEPVQWYGTPIWDPSGNFIAFTFYKVIPESICFIQPDGSNLRTVTRGRNPDFSPDGSEIALNIGNQIYIYNLQTQQLTQLTYDGSNYSPDWSPDGNRIAFDSNFQDSEGSNVIWLMNPDGSKKTDISIHSVGEWKTPDWIINFKILHVRYDDGPQIYIMDSTGCCAQKLTLELWNTHPQISPDRSKIVWQRWDLHSNNDLFLMNIDGSEKILLVKDGRHPAWSPNGTKIVYWKYGVFTPGEPWNDDDPNVHGSLWIYDIAINTHEKILP